MNTDHADPSRVSFPASGNTGAGRCVHRRGKGMLRETITPTNPAPISERETRYRWAETLLICERRDAEKDGRFSDEQDAKAMLVILRSMIMRERMRNQ